MPIAAGAQVYAFVDENLTTGGGTFAIEVNRCARETEPNDAPQTAGTPACGLEGSITPAGDADYFSLGAPAAGARVFALADGVSGNPDGVDLRLRVTTAADTLEFDEDDADLPFGGSSPVVAGTPLTGEASYLRIDHSSSASQGEPYRLYAVLQPSIEGAALETEPNNSTSQPNPAAGAYYSGALAGPAPSTDADVFPVTVAAGDLLFLGLDGDPLRDNTPINPRLDLLDPSGTVLVSVNDPDSIVEHDPQPRHADRHDAEFPFREPDLSRHRVGDLFRQGVDRFGVRGSTGAGDYLLSISKNCATGADLAVTQTDSPDPVGPGQQLVETLTVQNLGPGAAVNVQLSNPVPADATFASVTPPPGWSCTAPPAGWSGNVVCTTAGMPANSTAVFTLVLNANQCAPDGTLISNVATVSSATGGSGPWRTTPRRRPPRPRAAPPAATTRTRAR